MGTAKEVEESVENSGMVKIKTTKNKTRKRILCCCFTTIFVFLFIFLNLVLWLGRLIIQGQLDTFKFSDLRGGNFDFDDFDGYLQGELGIKLSITKTSLIFGLDLVTKNSEESNSNEDKDGFDPSNFFLTLIKFNTFQFEFEGEPLINFKIKLKKNNNEESLDYFENEIKLDELDLSDLGLEIHSNFLEENEFGNLKLFMNSMLEGKGDRKLKLNILFDITLWGWYYVPDLRLIQDLDLKGDLKEGEGWRKLARNEVPSLPKICDDSSSSSSPSTSSSTTSPTPTSTSSNSDSDYFKEEREPSKPPLIFSIKTLSIPNSQNSIPLELQFRLKQNLEARFSIPIDLSGLPPNFGVSLYHNNIETLKFLMKSFQSKSLELSQNSFQISLESTKGLLSLLNREKLIYEENFISLGFIVPEDREWIFIIFNQLGMFDIYIGETEEIIDECPTISSSSSDEDSSSSSSSSSGLSSFLPSFEMISTSDQILNITEIYYNFENLNSAHLRMNMKIQNASKPFSFFGLNIDFSSLVDSTNRPFDLNSLYHNQTFHLQVSKKIKKETDGMIIKEGSFLNNNEGSSLITELMSCSPTNLISFFNAKADFLTKEIELGFDGNCLLNFDNFIGLRTFWKFLKDYLTDDIFDHNYPWFILQSPSHSFNFNTAAGNISLISPNQSYFSFNLLSSSTTPTTDSSQFSLTSATESSSSSNEENENNVSPISLKTVGNKMLISFNSTSLGINLNFLNITIFKEARIQLYAKNLFGAEKNLNIFFKDFVFVDGKFDGSIEPNLDNLIKWASETALSLVTTYFSVKGIGSTDGVCTDDFIKSIFVTNLLL